MGMDGVFMSIITVSREFGSGGREVGKRLADALGYAYYDREIVSAIAQKTSMDEGYVASALEGGMFRSVPIHFGRTFSCAPALMSNTAQLYVEQHKIIRELAQKGSCIIVGRAADAILAEYEPFNLFVYATCPQRYTAAWNGRRKGRNSPSGNSSAGSKKWTPSEPNTMRCSPTPVGAEKRAIICA